MPEAVITPNPPVSPAGDTPPALPGKGPKRKPAGPAFVVTCAGLGPWRKGHLLFASDLPEGANAESLIALGAMAPVPPQ